MGAGEIAVFSAASEAFTKKNTNCTIAESLDRISEIVEKAKPKGIKIRGYISCVVGCPYKGKVEPEEVLPVSKFSESLELLKGFFLLSSSLFQLVKSLDALGCYEISLGDTIGVGTPGSFRALLDQVVKVLPPEKIAMHCHDTFGQALVNVLTSLEVSNEYRNTAVKSKTLEHFLNFQYGIAVVDSSVAGLGGCPYAAGATGNLATEDLVYMLQGMGIETGINLSALVATGNWICNHLKKPNNSKVGKAYRIDSA